MDVWAITEYEKPLTKIQEPIPEPKGKEVLIQVTHSGVCHSDLHLWDGWYDIGDGERFYFSQRGVTLPRAPGHEILGDIVKAGPDSSETAIGARRIVYPWVGCGECLRCDNEQDNMCTAQKSLGIRSHGGFAEYVVVPDSKYLVDPGDLDPAFACTFGCSGITTLSAVTHAMPMEPQEPCVLIGAGGLGLAAISMLRALGHQNIISVDLSIEKLEAASKAGATSVVDASKGNVVEGIKSAASNKPLLRLIDFVNNSSTAPIAQEVLAKGARWIQVGVMGGQVKLNLVGMILKGLTIVANLTGNPEHLRKVTSLALEGKLPSMPLRKMSWDSDANTALQLLKDGKVTGRIVLVR